MYEYVRGYEEGRKEKGREEKKKCKMRSGQKKKRTQEEKGWVPPPRLLLTLYGSGRVIRCAHALIGGRRGGSSWVISHHEGQKSPRA